MPVCGNYLFFELPKKIVLNPKDGPTASAKKSSSQAVFWTFLFSPLSQKRLKFQESLKKGSEDALYAIRTFNESAQDTMTILHF